MEYVLFIVDPHAGSGRTNRVWSLLCDRMPGLPCNAIHAALTPAIRRVVVLGAMERCT
ncbi:hypothetical protein QN362_05180 [Actimicrobium sp. CCC2.4]|uniref:hypothetical protein n=1 Tax=Actimicrobium sp. CCC2.4 TaxID=3048606 RepID=UPI002AC9B7CE|nr:hypothetical protein [Actimicrobium sp. CCC2.4]MEB0134720.1 hypothetical protein [Actimicrobium sp. CCC2.4]WPX30662.1 hypothetical protein RHM62_10265 [Actimicrobium sp. CCC2.4]